MVTESQTHSSTELQSNFEALRMNMGNLFSEKAGRIFSDLETSQEDFGMGYAETPNIKGMLKLTKARDSGGGVPSYMGGTTEMSLNQLQFPTLYWTSAVKDIRPGEKIIIIGQARHYNWAGTYESGVGLVDVEAKPKEVQLKIELAISADAKSASVKFSTRNLDTENEPWEEFVKSSKLPVYC